MYQVSCPQKVKPSGHDIVHIYYIKYIFYLRHFEGNISLRHQDWELRYLVVEVSLFKYERKKERERESERERIEKFRA